MPVLGFLGAVSSPDTDADYLRTFRQGLKDTGAGCEFITLISSAA